MLSRFDNRECIVQFIERVAFEHTVELVVYRLLGGRRDSEKKDSGRFPLKEDEATEIPVPRNQETISGGCRL
jgi:hypothetical protein